MPAVLIDTNLLVYAVDPRDKSRQEKAVEVIKALGDMEEGCLSVQCLSEFAAVVTRKLSPPLTGEEALEQVERLIDTFPILSMTQLVVLEAIRGLILYHFSYYDAQLWATARLNQVPLIFSEDFDSGSTIEGVTFVNPFEKSFRLEDWITYR